MRIILPLLALFLSSQLYAQYHEAPPWRDSDQLPAWIRLMQQEPVNVVAVDEAFARFYEGRLLEKNQYTQYYKRWRRWAEGKIDADGWLRLRTVEDDRQLEQGLRKLRNQGLANSLQKAAAAQWQFIGPNTTYSFGANSTKVTWQSNIYSLDQSLSNPDVLFAGGESGGIFKTMDHGISWQQVSGDILHDGVRPVAIHPTDERTVYAGTSGKIVRSSDGGDTWVTAYQESGLWTHDMVIIPDVPEVVIASTSKGLLRSSDAGVSWEKIFTEECWTLALRPNDNHTVYTVRDSLDASVFCISTDAGASFASSVDGWWQPTGDQKTYGVRLTVSADAPATVYALIGASATTPNDLFNYAGVFVSTDGGVRWRNTNPAGSIGIPYSIPDHTNLSAADGLTGLSQGFYDYAIIANPLNAQELVAGGTSWWRSSNGGATWNPLGGYASGLPWAHPDMQWLSARGDELWICSDGGINYSTDFALTHEARMDGLAGSDFWGFDVGWNEDVLVGGRYHNGNTAWFESYPAGEFLRMGGGEAATGYVNPGENSRVYFSDIGGRTLPGSRSESAGNFSVGLWPNESYYYTEFSEMEFDPRCWNTVYIGSGSGVWRSADGGASYSLLADFIFGTDSSARVEHIEIPRSNPDVIYITQRSNRMYDGRILRSTDAGVNWTVCAELPGTAGRERRLMSLACEADNPDVIWVALRAAPSSRNVFRSNDGGQSWENLSVSLPAGVAINDIVHQLGTESGIYLATDRGVVYYRNGTMTEWVDHSSGLPLSLGTRSAKIFYRDGMLRLGSNMGIWEAPLFEPSKPAAQISVDKMRSACPRDTFYFEDHSVLPRDSEARWLWDFPGASYVSSTTARNPRVTYPGEGRYGVSLTVWNSRGSSSQTLDDLITIEGSDCLPDGLPGNAVVLGGNDDPGIVQVPPLGIRTNTWTFTAWVKPDGIQPSFSSIFTGSGAEISIDGSNELHYFWPPNGQWWIGSGLFITPGKWSHVALSVAADSLTLYVNGIGWTRRHANDSISFSEALLIGNYKGWSSRHFKGIMDEICIYDRTLTRDEIRESMHLTREGTEDGLISYYQFNEAEGPLYDRIALRHAQAVGSARRVLVNGPYGAGVSQRLWVDKAKAYTFETCGLSFGLAEVPPLPDGEIVCSRISLLPDNMPVAVQAPDGYWIVDNFGTNQVFSPPDSLSLSGMINVRSADADEPAVFSLHRRDPNAADTLWTPLGRAASVEAGDPGIVSFPAGSGFIASSQLLLLRDGSPSGIGSGSPPLPQVASVYPTVLHPGEVLTVHPSNGEEVAFLLYSPEGRLIFKGSFSGVKSIPTAGLSAGSYLYWLRGAARMTSGRITVY
ncbi:MAG: LamG-like jellyroll fold domain-containing protein [Bacteroidota bacterium]